MDKNANLIDRLRRAAELGHAVVARDAARKASPGDRPQDVAARLQANHRVIQAARKLVD